MLQHSCFAGSKTEKEAEKTYANTSLLGISEVRDTVVSNILPLKSSQ
jgi:hypothetical protein